MQLHESPRGMRQWGKTKDPALHYARNQKKDREKKYTTAWATDE